MIRKRFALPFGVYVLMMFIALTVPGAVSGREYTDYPDDLEPWKEWVLHGYEEQLCPHLFNNGEAVRCVWPSRLKLEVNRQGGVFRQEWTVFSPSWIPLPGGPGVQPENVVLNGKEAPVLNRNGLPFVYADEGDVRIEGAFSWKDMPETIPVPPAGGLIELVILGKKVDFPVMDDNGRLWLQKRVEKPKDSQDRIDVRIQRLIDDGIPMTVTTILNVDISGRSRELSLNDVLLDGSIPTSLRSKMPARIGVDGELKLQARPGRWQIHIGARFEGPITKIGPVKGRYGQETWAFQPQNQFRMVKVLGVASVDPAQTDIPATWKQNPVYLMDPGSEMELKVVKRGDPDPAPDRLSLVRTWWLDFKGDGFTIQDRITGAMSTNWYLAMNPPGMLGRVSVDGRDQLITQQGESGKPGVELRKGNLNLVADSRFEESINDMPAVGWDHNFQSVSGVLNIPPGWRLITATGVDVAPGTWFEQWTLLDLFIVLIVAMAVFKLSNWYMGLLALITLGLTYHEPGAPRLVWLNLLAAVALLKVLPRGIFKKLVDMWRLGSIITLIVLSIPFMVNQVRIGMYPQLEHQYRYQMSRPGTMAEAPRDNVILDEEIGQYEANVEYEQKAQYARSSDLRMKKAPAPARIQTAKDKTIQKQAVLTQDPNALIQTGPGLPSWQWRSINMRWNGPVDKDQRIHFWFLSPLVNFVLAILRVVLLALLIVGLIDFRRWWKKLDKAPAASAGVLILVALTPAAALAVQPLNQVNLPVEIADQGDGSGGFPPQHILNEFRNRLLEPPDCLPYCAAYTRMNINLEQDAIQILLEVHTAENTAVPLPGGAKAWTPQTVLLDDSPADSIQRDRDGTLWVLAPKGIHRILLSGPVPGGPSFQIPIPLKPAATSVNGHNWEIQGVLPDGRVESNIQFTRLKTEEGGKSEEVWESKLPPYLHVERTLILGLNWQVHTSVRRVTPTGDPVVASIPLLKGESVTTADVQVKEGRARINFGPKSYETEWISTLDSADQIILKAPEDVPWTETWILDASPVWHCDLKGIPIIHHQDQEGHWRPQWRPWPGESVEISISRPAAIPGRTVTIDSARLEYTPGQRFNKAGLKMSIRSSLGGQHQLEIPSDARLQQVQIDGRTQPIGQQGEKVVLPLKPGRQTIYLEWHQPSESSMLIDGPRVKIGDEAVNAEATFNIPGNRWVLWASGPRLGPAVLFWSYLAVVVLAALALGRIRWTPLKTRHWLLLSLGLTQVHPLTAIVIVGWLLVLGVREKKTPADNWFVFNTVQIGLAIWTVIALVGLYTAIEKGLLGIPHMQISGNYSSDFQLNWTQDRIGGIMPQPWVLSLHRMVYHVLMLIWALWLALSLLRWLRWGWHAFGEGGLWKNPPKRIKVKKTPPPVPSEPARAESGPPTDDNADSGFVIE